MDINPNDIDAVVTDAPLSFAPCLALDVPQVIVGGFASRAEFEQQTRATSGSTRRVMSWWASGSTCRTRPLPRKPAFTSPTGFRLPGVGFARMRYVISACRRRPCCTATPRQPSRSACGTLRSRTRPGGAHRHRPRTGAARSGRRRRGTESGRPGAPPHQRVHGPRSVPAVPGHSAAPGRIPGPVHPTPGRRGDGQGAERLAPAAYGRAGPAQPAGGPEQGRDPAPARHPHDRGPRQPVTGSAAAGEGIRSPAVAMRTFLESGPLE